MFHCADYLQLTLKQQHLQDAARLWDWCARAINFSPAQDQSEQKTGYISLTESDGQVLNFRLHISQNQLQRKGWLWQTQPKLRQLYQNHLLCKARAINATEAVCYAEEKIPSSDVWRAVLLIKIADNYFGAHEVQKRWSEKTLEQRKPFLLAWANQLVQLHNNRLAHHNLHTVNLLIDVDTLSTRMDHLEHMGFQWRTVVASVNDLGAFMAGMRSFDAADVEYFLQQYWRECKLGLTYQGLRQRVLAQVPTLSGLQ